MLGPSICEIVDFLKNRKFYFMKCLDVSIAIFIVVLLLSSCQSFNPPTEQEDSEVILDKIKLPEGYEISIYADNVVNARSMTLSPSGTLYVGTRSEGKVYAIQDHNRDYVADTIYTILSDANMPNGVAFNNGDLYIAEVDRILKFKDIESKLNNPGEPMIIYDDYPGIKHHGWKYIAFGPDGKLYVPVGAPCNICDSKEDIFNSITRLDKDGTNFEIIQRGIRNTVGFTWHPESGDLWFTDNGRDNLGDDKPSCELNKAAAEGLHFGYPYCHQGDLLDPEFGEGKDCADYQPPVVKLNPHSAPLGIEFVKSKMFPSNLSNTLLIAEHGSWNRSTKIGYRLSQINFDEDGNSEAYINFASGWLDENTDEAWGRPVDLEWLDDGSLLVSDDFADVIYRIIYKG